MLFILVNILLYIVFIFISSLLAQRYRVKNLANTFEKTAAPLSTPPDHILEQQIRTVRAAREQRDTKNDISELQNKCNDPFGLFVDFINNDIEQRTTAPPNCNSLCSGTLDGTYRHVATDNNVLINGSSTIPNAYYCVRTNISVIKCNTATSDVVRGSNGSWSCKPRWPNIFGGPAGNTIMVCGGYLDDGQVSYIESIPDNAYFPAIKTNPYDERLLGGGGGEGGGEEEGTSDFRFKCTPGKYSDGPTDYMGNKYVSLPDNRFYRLRNGCSKYIYNSVDTVTYDSTKPGYCNCLKNLHGPLRLWDGDRYVNSNSKTSGSTGGDIMSVPYICSPCIHRLDLAVTGVANVPRACVKGANRYASDKTWANKSLFPKNPIDILPCGSQRFSNSTDPACHDGMLLVTTRSASHDTMLLIDGIKRGTLT